MPLNTDETINIIKQVNQELSDLVDLSYTDFYSPERFVALFELAIDEVGTLFDYCINIDNFYFNRLFFIKEVIYTLIHDKNKRYTKKIINAIRREFKGLHE